MRLYKKLLLHLFTLFLIFLFPLISFAQPTSGLLAYYPFTGNANDASGNNVHLTIDGPSISNDRYAFSNRCYYFDSVDKMYATVGSSFSVSNLTIAFWIQPTGPGVSNPRIVKVGTPGGAGNYYEVSLIGTGSPRSLTFNAIGSSSFQLTTGGPWQHVAITYDGSYVRYYLNGSLSNSVAYSGTLGSFSSAKLTIGYNDNNNDYFNGFLDEIRIYNRALTASEIYQCYSPTNGLLAYYSMNNTSDSTGNNNDLTPSNVSLTTDRFGNANSSYSFSSNSSMYANVASGYVTSTVTLSAWIAVSGAGDNNPRIVGVGPLNNSAQNYSLILEGTGFARRLQFYNNGNTVSSVFYIPTNSQWYHVAATYNGSSVRFYLNGVFTNAVSYSGSLGSFTSARLQIGYSDNGLDHFVGKLDEIRIYNRVLSDAEIYQLYIPYSGILSYYSLNSTSDSTGNTGNLTTANVTQTTDRYGTANACYLFNGSNSRMYTTASNMFSTPSVTLSAWISVTGAGNYNPRIIGVGFTGTSYQNYSLILVGTGNPRSFAFYAADGASTQFQINSTVTIPSDGSWNHVAATFDGYNVRLYLNGTLVTSTTVSNYLRYFSGTARVVLGYSDNNYDFFQGKIDECRIYNRALSASEIQSLYTPPILTVTYQGNPITPPLDFGAVTLGSNSQRIVRFTNTGGNRLTFSGSTISGDYTRLSFPASLEPNQFFDNTLTFTPTASGTRTGTLSVTHNAEGSPYNLSLTGVGQTPPSLSVTYEGNPITPPLDFGTVIVGFNSNEVIRLINTGEVPLTITNPNITGDFTTSTIPTSISGNSYVDVTLTFTPSATGTRNGTLSFSHNASGSPYSLSLTGIGATSPTLLVTYNGNPITPPLNFGALLVGSSGQRVIRLTNNGTLPLMISNVSITGDYSTSQVPSSIGGNSYADVTLTFTPSGLGTLTGTFSFTHNASLTPYELDLTGLGCSYTAGSGVPAEGPGGPSVPWTPSLPNDNGTGDLPPVEVIFPGTSGVTPSSINISYRLTPPNPSVPAFLPSNSISRYYTLNQTGGSNFGATLIFRFTASDNPNNILSDITVARSTDGGTTWTSFATGLAARPNGSVYEVEVTGVDEFSDWGLGTGTPLPVLMTAFTAVGGDRYVNLYWRTESEVANDYFVLYRSVTPDERGVQIARIDGRGTAFSPYEYRYRDSDVQNGTMYFYRIADVDFNGVEYLHPMVVSAQPMGRATGVIPSEYDLTQNYPNPFNPVTEFSYSIPEAGVVRLSVYNLYGQEVRRLVKDEYQHPNVYRVKFDGSNLPSGIYLYVLSVNEFRMMKRMVLMK
ncbi:MAG: choice-of-anchor D domain-containing protein [bacterium]|nr:choice-of-anchor D domain-containing protein [bacterium]